MSKQVDAFLAWMSLDVIRGAVMFEEFLLKSSSLLGRGVRWPVLLAVVIEAVVVAALLIFPLLHPEIVRLGTPSMMVFAPHPVRQPPPPPTRVIQAETASSTTAPQVSTMQRPQISIATFQGAAQTVDQPALAVGVNLGDVGQSLLAAIGSVGTRAVVGVAAASSAGPVNVSTGVMQGQLIEPILPQYPAIARMSRSEGTVVVKAIISKTGTIESAHVESGPVILQAAALDAVRRARYRPFLLNDQPTEVETTISIVFRIGS